MNNATASSQCGCGIGYYDDASRCPHMETAVTQCVSYFPVVYYNFEDLGNLGADVSGHGYHLINFYGALSATQGGNRPPSRTSTVQTVTCGMTRPGPSAWILVKCNKY
mmetsp:Transcript_17687/g.39996  ORF Transcript_17687/g.39996 Transcript_17687/m.39996 type:complete len:108 (+) Transcript_17687:925-1248(+)